MNSANNGLQTVYRHMIQYRDSSLFHSRCQSLRNQTAMNTGKDMYNY